MNNLSRIYLITLLGFNIISSSSITQKKPDNRPIRLTQKNELNIITNGKAPDCRYLAEVIGSEGHCYTYLFRSFKRYV